MTDGMMRSRHNKNINKRKQLSVRLPTVTQLRALWRTNWMSEDEPLAEDEWKASRMSEDKWKASRMSEDKWKT